MPSNSRYLPFARGTANRSCSTACTCAMYAAQDVLSTGGQQERCATTWPMCSVSTACEEAVRAADHVLWLWPVALALAAESWKGDLQS